jgi:hypothetical protein
MNINYEEQSRFFQRFSKGVREELQNSRKMIIDSIDYTEKLIEKVESSSSKFLGIMKTDKKIVIDKIANILSDIEKYEEKLPSYYYDMQTIFRCINQYRVAISTLKIHLSTLLNLPSTKTSSATDEFSRLALSEQIDVTSKNIKNYSSFVDTMTAFIDEEEIKDMVDVKIRLFALKDKIVTYLINMSDESDEFHQVLYFFNKDNISETYHRYSKSFSQIHTFFQLFAVTCIFYFMYFLKPTQDETCL